jgi:iron-sulfur cluster insertion protein
MSDVAVQFPIEMSDAAAAKVKALITEEENPELKLRVYITGGGCSGFQYGFTFDEKINDGDTVIEKDNVIMVVDGMSLQYLVGGVVDYIKRKAILKAGTTATGDIDPQFQLWIFLFGDQRFDFRCRRIAHLNGKLHCYVTHNYLSWLMAKNDSVYLSI